MTIHQVPAGGQLFHKSSTTDIVLAELEAAIRWLETCTGRSASSTRFSAYLRVLREWKAGQLKLSGDELLSVLNATSHAYELIEIHQTLAKTELVGLAKKLRKYMTGPELEKDELSSSSSNLARNIGFELLLLARFCNCGLKVSLSSGADIVISREGIDVAIECKRPQTERKIEDSIKDAHRQLRLRRKGRKPGVVFIGMVALSVGKLWHGADKFVLTSDPAAFSEMCETALSRLRALCEPPWHPLTHKKYSHLLLLNLRAFVLHDFEKLPVSGEETNLIERDAYSGQTQRMLREFVSSTRGMLNWGNRR